MKNDYQETLQADRANDSLNMLRPAIVMFFVPGECKNRRLETCRDLWRKKNFAGVRIFYWAPRRKTKDLHVAGIRSERTRD